jgi:hypothetical protein
MPTVVKVAAISTLVIWIGIACCGRWIAYYEPRYKDDKDEASLFSPAERSLPVVAAQNVRHVAEP